jgi:hypothetical protein
MLKSEDSCENISFRLQNNSMGLEYGLKNGETNFNMKKSVCESSPKESE